MHKWNFILIFILIVACKKADISTQTQTRIYPPVDTTVAYLVNKIEFHWLKWTVHEDQHLLTTELNVPKPYSIKTLILVHAQNGSKAFDIPEYDGVFTPTVYYKIDSVTITIYAFYNGTAPLRNIATEDENAYLNDLYYFAGQQTGIGNVQIYFDPTLYHDDNSLDSTQFVQRLQWVGQSEHLLAATVDIPPNYATGKITKVIVMGVDTATVPLYDSSAVQNIYYKSHLGQVVIFLHSDAIVPLQKNFSDALKYLITFMEWQITYGPPYHTGVIKLRYD